MQRAAHLQPVRHFQGHPRVHGAQNEAVLGAQPAVRVGDLQTTEEKRSGAGVLCCWNPRGPGTVVADSATKKPDISPFSYK